MPFAGLRDIKALLLRFFGQINIIKTFDSSCARDTTKVGRNLQGHIGGYVLRLN